jgi:hypothetical protein
VSSPDVTAPRPAGRPSLTGILLTALGLALFAWQVSYVGLDQILAGFAAIHLWGLAGILALSLARFTLRSFAWILLLEGRVPLRSALAATLGGDALGNLSFLSLLVSEPAKALYVTRHVPADTALGALTAENVCYSASVAIVIVAGTATLMGTFVLPETWHQAALLSLGLMTALLAAFGWLIWHQPALTARARHLFARLDHGRIGHLFSKLRDLEHLTYGAFRVATWRLWMVALCEVAFHVASVAEAWLTLWLLTGQSLLLHAFLLDTVNRVINVVFRAVPLRVGVDEVTTSGFAQVIGLPASLGVTLALVRKVRLLSWAVVGLAFVGRRALSSRHGHHPRR